MGRTTKTCIDQFRVRGCENESMDQIYLRNLHNCHASYRNVFMRDETRKSTAAESV